MAINIPAIYKSTYEHYQQAKNNIIAKGMFAHRADAISDVIPGLRQISSSLVHTIKKITRFYL